MLKAENIESSWKKIMFKQLFFSAFLINLLFMLAYCFLSWLLTVELDCINLNEKTILFWVPLSISWIPLVLFLLPKLHNYDFSKSGSKFGYLLFISLLSWVNTCFAHIFMERATGKFAELKSIAAFDHNKKVKYYQLQNYYLDTTKKVVISSSKITGKYNNNLNFYIYAITPIYAFIGDTINRECSYWIGSTYIKTVRNSNSNTINQEAYISFLNETKLKYKSTQFNQIKYFELVGRNSNLDFFNTATRRSSLVSYHDPIFFNAAFEPIAERYKESMKQFLIVISFTTALLLLITFLAIKNSLKPKVNSTPDLPLA